MVNYANTQLYELIEYDENGVPVVYRGHTTQPLHKRLSEHRTHFMKWKNGNKAYCSSFEVLKHGPARIELVKVVCCFNKKEAVREEGKFIRELPTCVNLFKNYANYAEYYQANKKTIIAREKKRYEANKETILAQKKAYHLANKETINAKNKAYHLANKETIKAKMNEYYHANKETIIAREKKRYEANKETILAKKNEKVTCECGAVIRRGSLTRHRNTWKHFHDFIHL